MFSYEELKAFNVRFISFMKDNLFCEGGLQFLSSKHFLFKILNSNSITSDPLKSYEFIDLSGIPSFTHIPPFLFLSFLKISQPSAENREFGNGLYVLVSYNKHISVSLRKRYLKLENLFLVELILRCSIITFQGDLDVVHVNH